MINFQNLENISPALLTVFLITCLILTELGNKKMKDALLPLVIVLIIIFLIIVVIDVLSMI